MAGSGTPFEGMNEPGDVSSQKTGHSDDLPALEQTLNAVRPTSPSLSWKRHGILITVTAFFIVVITITSMILAIYSSSHIASQEALPPNPTVMEGSKSYPAYMPGHGTLVFADSLNGSSTQNWKPTNGCSYSQNHYQVTTANQTQPIHVCLGPTMRNFAFEVQMTIIKGDCGGLVFRADRKNNAFYHYMVCELGVYGLTKHMGDNPGVRLVENTTSSAINGDVNQNNTLGVYANGDHIIVYVNGKQLGNVHDNASVAGQIGLDAVALVSESTQVLYSNARCWSL